MPLYAYQAHNRVMAVKDSRLAVRLSSEQDALIRHAAEVEGTSITEFTVAATLSHGIDVLADRRLFAIDDAAWNEFVACWTALSSTRPDYRSCSRTCRCSPRSERLQPARPISDQDDTSEFDSGEPSLSEYLRRRALANHVQGASRCFVTCADGRVVGYYALASASVHAATWPARCGATCPTRAGHPALTVGRRPGRTRQRAGQEPPARRHRTLGRTSDIIGVRAILVHALHDTARAFYTRFDFKPSPTDPLHLLLLIKAPAPPSVANPGAAFMPVVDLG